MPVEESLPAGGLGAMSSKVVDQPLEKALRRMDALQRRAATTSASHALLREALAELAASLQGLQVIDEEPQ